MEPIVLSGIFDDSLFYFPENIPVLSSLKINHMDLEISQVENVQSLMRNLF